MFITFEGGEGAGKSTQARLLTEALNTAGIPAQSTREPGGTANAEALRELLLDRERAWTIDAEVLLHFAARAEHLAVAIRPALACGATVVCDRFSDSTMAYQGYGLGGDRAMIATLTRLLPIMPDLTFVLHVTESVATHRLSGRRQALDRYEVMDPAFHDRVRSAFLDIADANPARCIVIDAEPDSGSVHRAIWNTVQTRLPALQ